MIVSYVNDAGQEFELADTGEISTGVTGVSPPVYSEYPSGYWSGVFDGYVSGVKTYDACDLKVCVQCSGAGTAWWFQWHKEDGDGEIVLAQNGGQNGTPLCFGNTCALPRAFTISEEDCENGYDLDEDPNDYFGYCDSYGGQVPQYYAFTRRVHTNRTGTSSQSYNPSVNNVNFYHHVINASGSGILDHLDKRVKLWCSA